MGTASSIGGAPVALVYQHAGGPRTRATLASIFVFGTVISIGTLAIAGAVLFTAASLLWALGQSAMSYNGSIIDWARKSLAELIAPAREG